eukprot:scaffold149_cov315-Pinguiococcus_pyrenoidosus.AAC.63
MPKTCRCHCLPSTRMAGFGKAAGPANPTRRSTTIQGKDNINNANSGVADMSDVSTCCSVGLRPKRTMCAASEYSSLGRYLATIRLARPAP